MSKKQSSPWGKRVATGAGALAGVLGVWSLLRWSTQRPQWPSYLPSADTRNQQQQEADPDADETGEEITP